MNQPKLALVTGSTKGIGKATAQALLRDGHTVIINSHAKVDLDFIKQEFNNPNAHFFQADISDKNQLQAMHDWVKE